MVVLDSSRLCGKKKQIVLYYVEGKSLLNLASFSTWIILFSTFARLRGRSSGTPVCLQPAVEESSTGQGAEQPNSETRACFKSLEGQT